MARTSARILDLLNGLTRNPLPELGTLGLLLGAGAARFFGATESLQAALVCGAAGLGILGLGHVGRSIAAAGRALGMLVIGTRRGRGAVAEADETLSPSETPALLARADYVVSCLPLTEETRGLLSADTLAALRPSAVLVDISRGPIARAVGLAELKFVTAAASTGVLIPGLPLAEAERLRDHLVAVAESRRAGL